ncbi:TPA: IS3 family transposase [Klebsiella pneumoniae]|nr:IS3 family transposase [Klebsiella pneumoniae]
MISRDLRHAQNVGARHRWHNRLQTVLLVLTLLGIAAVAGSLLLGDGGLWLALAAAGFTLLLEPAAASGLTLRLYGARPLHPDEAPDLWAVLRELAARAGLPTVPVPHYVPSGVVNAFATGSKHHAAIALTDGLLRSLTPRELTGVLGHEIAHIANEDLRVMGLADSISRLTHLLALLGQLAIVLSLPTLLLGVTEVNWPALLLIRVIMADIFEENYRCYDYRRLHAMLRGNNRVISEKVVRRLMAEEQLVVKRTRRRRYNSYCGEIGPAPENLLARDFSSCRPNEKWLTDITEFQLPAGKVYLSPVIDCFDGLVVSWSIGTRPDATLVNTMLDDALDTLNEHDKPVIHSDRGGHYRWPGWLERINTSGLIRSMSRKGCSSDNAACEGFFGRIKNEMFYGRDWAGITLEKFICFLDRYIRWYNEKRIKLSLGAMSPVKYRQHLGITT